MSRFLFYVLAAIAVHGALEYCPLDAPEDASCDETRCKTCKTKCVPSDTLHF